MSTISKTISTKASIINENEDIDYRKLIEANSEKIKSIPDEYYIFISHASNGDGAYPDEIKFVLALYDFLIVNYPDKVFLDLIKKPKIIYSEIYRAAQRSTYGVFICSPRYITIFNNGRGNNAQDTRQYEPISMELNFFHAKQRQHGFCMIPVCYGVTQDAFGDRSPFSNGTDTIFIENETLKNHLEKAEYVSLKIIEKIKEVESKKASH